MTAFDEVLHRESRPGRVVDGDARLNALHPPVDEHDGPAPEGDPAQEIVAEQTRGNEQAVDRAGLQQPAERLLRLPLSPARHDERVAGELSLPGDAGDHGAVHRIREVRENESERLGACTRETARRGVGAVPELFDGRQDAGPSRRRCRRFGVVVDHARDQARVDSGGIRDIADRGTVADSA